MGNCHPEKINTIWHWFSSVDNFPCYPLLQSISIILYSMLIRYLVNITFGFKTIKVKWIFLFVFRNPYIQTLIWRQSESMVNRTCINSAHSIFLEFTRRQAISLVFVRAWFHDSAGDIDFYQMSFSQSESSILH